MSTVTRLLPFAPRISNVFKTQCVRSTGVPHNSMDHKGEPPYADTSGRPDVVGVSQPGGEDKPDHETAPKTPPLPWQSDALDVSGTDRDCWPTQARRVSFADTFGLNLVSIKEFDARGTSTLPDLEADSKQQVEYWLSRLFSTPSSETELVRKLAESKIELQSVELLSGTTTLKGVVRVLNFCFDKRVYVRATLDGWASHFDLRAEFVPGSSDGQTDRFSFRLTLVPPFGRDGSRVEFCLRYETAAGTFWANNGGSNYVLYCAERGGKQAKEGLEKTRRSCLKGVGKEPSAGTEFSMGSCSSIRACSSLEVLGEHKHSSEAMAQKGPEVWCSEKKAEEDHEKAMVDNGQCSSERRKQRQESRLDQIRNHFAQREMATRLGGRESARNEEAMATRNPHHKKYPTLSGGAGSGHQTSSQGLGPPREPDLPLPLATESMINPGTNDTRSRTDPEAGLRKTEEVILEMKASDLCEAISNAKCVGVKEVNSEASFTGQPTAPQKVTSSGAREVSEQATNMHNEIGNENDISRKPCVQHVEATHGEVSLVRTEPKSDNHPSAAQHPFTFGIFVAPFYQQASYRMKAGDRDINQEQGEHESESVADFNWWEDEETENEDDSHDVGTQSETSADVPEIPADQSESWRERFLEASGGHVNVAKDKESIEDGTQNTMSGFQTQTFLNLECQEEHNTPNDGPSTEFGGSDTKVNYGRPADDAVTHTGQADEDSLAILQKCPNASLETTELVEGFGPDTFIANSKEGTENIRNLLEANVTAVTDLCSKNAIDVCKRNDAFGLNGDCNWVNDGESMNADGEDGRAESEEQNKGHKVYGDGEESLDDLKDPVFTDAVEESGNEEEFLKSKEDAPVEHKEETSLREVKKAFSEEVGVMPGIKERPGGEKVLTGDTEEFLMETKDSYSEGGYILLKTIEEGGREINNDDLLRKTLNKVVEIFRGGKDKDATGQDGHFREEETSLNMLQRNEKADQRDTLEGASHLPECEETIYSVNIEYTYEGETGLREESRVFTKEKVHPCKEGRGVKDEDVCKGNIFGEEYVNKKEQDNDLYFREEDGIIYAQRHEDDNDGLLEGRDGKKRKGDISEQNSMLLPEGEQAVYGSRYEDMGGVRGKDNLQDQDVVDEGVHRVLQKAESTFCEEREVNGDDIGDPEFHEEASSISAGEECLQSELNMCTEEGVAESSSNDSYSDDEMEQYVLGLKCHEKSSNPTTHPFRDVLTLVGKRNSISLGMTVRTPLPSIRESPYEGWYSEGEWQSGQPSTDLSVAGESINTNPVRLPPQEEPGKATRIHPFCKNDSSSFEDASKVVICGASAALLLVTAYHYDFIACLVLYLFSLFWLCCRGEKEWFASK
ncbi:uncharacterized protein LOC125738200 [Brienomyrus brachyistius]|uniref:uncharacterized protein LOC125738200 n=1 Tax=Brienomyrus brachyistius TaxID=42636 RepID=UPI0020B20444|nr:uncharacterized protein LOC125738200 [Brienomyrus brachyistius]